MDKNKKLSSMIPEDIKYASVMYLKNIAMDYCSNAREVYSEQDIIDVCEQVPLLYDVYNFSRLFGAMVNERPEREGRPIYYVSFLRSKENSKLLIHLLDAIESKGIGTAGTGIITFRDIKLLIRVVT